MQLTDDHHNNRNTKQSASNQVRIKICKQTCPITTAMSVSSKLLTPEQVGIA